MGVEDTRHSAYSFIRTNINYLINLPAPGEKWLPHEPGPGVKSRLRACLRHSVVEKHERPNPRYKRHYYTTDPVAYRDIQDVIERVDTLPCGHTGVQNLGDGEYSCGYEHCSEVFSRRVVEDALGWE